MLLPKLPDFGLILSFVFLNLIFRSWQILEKPQVWFFPVFLLPCLAVDIFFYCRPKINTSVYDCPPWHFLIQEISWPLSSVLSAIASPGCGYVSMKGVQTVGVVVTWDSGSSICLDMNVWDDQLVLWHVFGLVASVTPLLWVWWNFSLIECCLCWTCKT